MKMVILKAFLFVSLLCLVTGDDAMPPPGPIVESTTGSPPITTSSTTSAPITTQTPKSTTTTPTTTKPTSTTTPTTTSTTTTPKPTSSTSKPTPTPPPTTSTSKPTPPPTTTTAKPTPKPTTPPPVNPVGTWSVNYTAPNNNKICLVLEAQLDVDIHYKDGNATKTVSVQIPSTATATGVCNPQVENLVLTFDALPLQNSVTFTLKKSNDSKRFDLSSVAMVLNVNVSANDSRTFLLGHSKEEFSTPVSNSYKCAKVQELNLTTTLPVKEYDGVLKISKLQVQAFRNATSTKFDEALDCASSNETPDVVPIAVGCALAGLVIVVLVAYLIGRRRSQARGYLSM